MSTINDGGPAFPVADPFHLEPGNVENMKRIAAGMTLRDYFAAHALPEVAKGQYEAGGDCLPYKNFSVAAKDAYLMADAMIAARGSA